MEEEGKKNGGWWIPVLIVILVVAITGVMAYLSVNMHPEYDYLYDKLEEKGEVSVEYRRGWNDCIRELKNYWDSFQNITSQFSFVLRK